MKQSPIPSPAEATKMIQTNREREAVLDHDWLDRQFLDRLARTTVPHVAFQFNRAERHCHPDSVRYWGRTMSAAGYAVTHGLCLGSLTYGQIEIRWSV